ncbi:hypothetical protein HY572_06375 [Candidatus Micrarchaeota archaeon]|nr:hypothetical protein [Candidatus Micrarchaeota archaeon]
MIEATAAPDAFTWGRTVLALLFFLFVPGRKLLSGGPLLEDAVFALVFPFRVRLSFAQYVEAVVASVLLLAGIAVVLAFTVGLSFWTLVGGYALLAVLGLLHWFAKGL